MKPLQSMLRLNLATCCFLQLFSIVSGQSQLPASPSLDSLESFRFQNDDGTTRYIYPWEKNEYPNPVTQHRYCRMPVVSNVCDPDDILTFEQKIELDKLTRRLHQELKCYCSSCGVDSKGIAVGVALMQSIRRPFSVEPKNNTRDFADYLRTTWNLGTCGNDLIILVTTQDRMWSPSFGETAKQVLSAQVLDRLTQKAQEAFYNKNFYQGLATLLTSYFDELYKAETIVATLRPPTKVDPKKPSSLGLIIGIIVSVILILAIAVVIFFVIRRRKQKQRDQQRLRNQEEVEKLKKNHDDDQNNDPKRSFVANLKQTLSLKRSQQESTPLQQSDPSGVTQVVQGAPLDNRKLSTDLDDMDYGEQDSGDVYKQTTTTLQ